MSTNASLQIILIDIDKWDDWEMAFLFTAQDRMLLRIVEGTKRPLDEPEPPTPSHFYEPTIPTQNTRAGSVSSQAVRKWILD